MVLGRFRGCIDRIFPLGLINEKCLSDQTPLVLCFIDDEQTFDSVDKRAKVLSLYHVPDKYVLELSKLYVKIVR